MQGFDKIGFGYARTTKCKYYRSVIFIIPMEMTETTFTIAKITDRLPMVCGYNRRMFMVLIL